MIDLPTRCKVAFILTPDRLHRKEANVCHPDECPEVLGLRPLGMLEVGVLRMLVDEDRREAFVRDIAEGRMAIVEYRLGDAGWFYAFIHPAEGG